jgi:hypothetical protein
MQLRLGREIATYFRFKRRGTAIAIVLGLVAATVVGSSVAVVVEILDDWF